LRHGLPVKREGEESSEKKEITFSSGQGGGKSNWTKRKNAPYLIKKKN